MADERYFYATCKPVDTANCSGNYLDPCDCKKYYQCVSTRYILIRRECPESTAYDGEKCDYSKNVFIKGLCNLTAPWERCKDIGSDRMKWLQGFCTNTTYTSIPISTTPLNAVVKQAAKNEDNTGLIVGLVIALVIIVILAAAFGVFWYRRRKQRDREGKSTLPHMENPQYFAENDDEYQQIDESMHNPTYNAKSTVRPSLPARPEGRITNGTLQTANLHENDFVYDNRAFRDETGIPQSLECTTGNIGNPHSYTTLKSVDDIATGYDRVGTVGNALYSSESTMIAETSVNWQSKTDDEAVRDETGIPQSLECTTGNIGNPHSYTTLKSVENIATGYGRTGTVENALYNSENAMIGEAFMNPQSKTGAEAFTQ